jgi:hypothetical protein
MIVKVREREREREREFDMDTILLHLNYIFTEVSKEMEVLNIDHKQTEMTCFVLD